MRVGWGVDAVATKYRIYDFEDYTKNIYGIKIALSRSISRNSDRYKLTDGVHIHFSSREKNTGGG